MLANTSILSGYTEYSKGYVDPWTAPPNPDINPAEQGREWLRIASVMLATRMQRAFAACTTATERQVIADAAHDYGIQAPKGCDLRGKMLRLCDERWWRRQLKKWWLRDREHRAARAREVGARTTAHYVAHDSANLIAAADDAADRALKARKLRHTQTGDEISLYNVAQYAREGRIAELYTFAKGLADYAAARQLTWCMTTLKLPGEYHPNPKFGRNSYNGASFEAMHEKLSNTWKLIRTQAHNRGIKIMGLRVTEAHKDGCPHWHFMVYVDPAHRAEWEQLVCEYAPGQQSDFSWAWTQDEAAARGKRVAGSASYLLKYIVKAVARESSELQQFSNADELTTHMAPRVVAKRRAHGWRAFQFFGIKSSMTSWRTMRAATTPPTTAVGRALYAAANDGRAGAWLELLNSEGAPRFMPLREQTGRVGRYGELVERTEGAILVDADGVVIEAFRRLRRFEITDDEQRQAAEKRWRDSVFAVVGNCARGSGTEPRDFDDQWCVHDVFDSPDPPF